MTEPPQNRKTLTRQRTTLIRESKPTESALLSGNIEAARWAMRRALRSVSRGNIERAKQQIITALEALETND